MSRPLLPAVPDAEFWTSSDPLSEVLHLLRMNGAFYALSELSAPWGVEMPALTDTLMFHFVTEGGCWLEVEGLEPRRLEPGTLALVPHGRGHSLVSEAGGPAEDLFSIPREELSERYERIRHGGGGEPTCMVCGAVHFDGPAARRLIEALPRLLVADTWSTEESRWLRGTLDLMAAEARGPRPGGETVVTRLADVLVIQALRAWMARQGDAGSGWLRAIRDPRIGRAMALVHREPAAPWTVERLASAVGMSRSGFAARFQELADETPLHYVTRWRMNLALDLLREENLSLAGVAERLGYHSEAAFSRAFKRTLGVSPGRARRDREVSA